jgi:hypothetical protein
MATHSHVVMDYPSAAIAADEVRAESVTVEATDH